MDIKDLFGVNASQTAFTLSINKADLPRLTPTSNNSAESLLVGILLLAIQAFNGVVIDSNGEELADSNNESISYSAESDYDIYLYFWRSYYSSPYAMRQLVFQQHTSI